MRNIGNSFVRLGMFGDAINSFEAIMEGLPDYRTGFNLIVCYFALGDADKMRKGFMRVRNFFSLVEESSRWFSHGVLLLRYSC
jgi:intraflagellar transport protein 88